MQQSSQCLGYGLKNLDLFHLIFLTYIIGGVGEKYFKKERASVIQIVTKV